MPIAYQSSTTSSPSIGTSASGLAKPAGTAIGDVLVAQILAKGGVASGPFAIASAGDTWTLVHDNVALLGGQFIYFYVWIGVVANASSTIGITWGGATLDYGVSIHRFAGVDTSVPQDVTATENTGTSQTETGTGVASGTANRHFVLCTGNLDGFARAFWSSAVTERVDASYVGMASGTDTAGTDTNSKGGVLTATSTWFAVLLALRAPVFQGTASPSIRLSMSAFAYPNAQSSPRITLSVATTTRLAQVTTATPGITLGIAATAQIGYLAQAAPGIRLALAGYAVGGITSAGSTVIELEYNRTGNTVAIDRG